MKYKEVYIDTIEVSEIDLDAPFYTGDERSEIEHSKDVTWYDTESIAIDEALRVLQLLKLQGSERVYLFAHSDHHGYIFTGVKLDKV